MSKSTPPAEARFHSKLFDKLDDYIETNDTNFSEVVIEQNIDGRRADIHLQSHLTTSLIIEVKRDDKNILSSEAVKQARDYADSVGADFFATCTSNDFFLFDYTGDEVERGDYNDYYINLRDIDPHDTTLSGFIPWLLNALDHLHTHNKLPNQPLRENIIGALRQFHSSVWPTYHALAKEKYGKRGGFDNALDEWAKENDYTNLDQDKLFRIAAKQHSYLLTNKILFYELIRPNSSARTNSGNRLRALNESKSGHTISTLESEGDMDALKSILDERFSDIVSEIDYEPIFDDQDTLFEKFPENYSTLDKCLGLITALQGKELDEVDEDLLSELYEELIPEQERKELGQYYTPPKVAEAIVRWAVPNKMESLPKVFDPACGSGTFPVEVYNHLRRNYRSAAHQEMIDSIGTIDINKFPLHLTALNLSIRNIQEPTDRLNAIHDSFFNVDPGMILPGEANEFGQQGTFDAVVGNPPYIKHQKLYPGKEHFRSHLRRYEETGGGEYYSGDKRFSKQTDAYIYFVTHALQFLKEGGRLGFIIPSKWMDVRYGEAFREFLLEQTKVHAVVDFKSRVFEDAQVNTCLLLVEKCSSENKREDNTVDFIRIKDTMEPGDLVDTISYEKPIGANDKYYFENRSGYSVVSKPQAILEDDPSRNWGYYLSAPRPIIELVESGRLTPLNDFATISRGITTGANKFFFLKDEDVEQWGIDERFLTPAIKSMKDVDGPNVPAEGVGRYILDVHSFVERIVIDSEEDSIDAVKTKLREGGYDGLLQYIIWGENQGYDTRNTCSTRSVWFDLGEFTTPSLLHPKGFNDNIFTIVNSGLVANNRIYEVSPNESISEGVLRVLLNSTVYKVMLEIFGRAEGGGILELAGYEVGDMLVPDVRQLDEEVQQQIADASQYIGASDGQEKIDKIVIEEFGLGIEVGDLHDIHDFLVETRVEGADPEVLIKALSDFDDIALQFTPQSNSSDDGVGQNTLS